MRYYWLQIEIMYVGIVPIITNCVMAQWYPSEALYAVETALMLEQTQIGLLEKL